MRQQIIIRMNSQEVSHEKVLNTKVKQYMICRQLGSGTSSTVYLALNTDTRKEVAIKVIPKEYLSLDKKLMELVKTQIYVLKACNNENIVKCYDVFQSTLSIFIVMEYCNGLDMEEYVGNKKYLSEDHAVWYLKQILNGFKGLHEEGAMHRDFKLANLLLHDRVCKIADLGFAKQMKDQDLTDTILGTQITMAPQILERKPYGINADIWSLGVVFYQMLTGKYPYKGVSGSDLLKNIKQKHCDFANLRISPLARNFIQGCLTEDPAARITWIEIYNHQLLNKRTVELTYGISKVTQIFYENRQFYRQQTLDDSQDSLLILRNSARKELILEEIQQVQLKASECDALYRNALENKENEKLLITYGIHYGAYLNQLSYPLKFLNLDQAPTLPGAEQLIPLYLIGKKAYTQVRDFLSIIQKRINIFKIEILWAQFIKCSIYSDICTMVKICLERAELIFKKTQDRLRKLSVGQLNARVAWQMEEDNVKNQEFSVLLQEYKAKYLQCMLKVLMDNQKQDIGLIDFCQALLYYSDSKVQVFYYMDKGENKKKVTPERFDWSRSKSISYKEAKAELINKFKLILSA